MPKAKRKNLSGRGSAGKIAVIGAKYRKTNRVAARTIENTDRNILHGFVAEIAADGAKVYTDNAKAYRGISNREVVYHSAGEYVRGQAHTNGIESFWSMLKRGYHGTYHHMSAKHLDRNERNSDTINQMSAIARRMVSRQLRYRELVA